MSKIASTTNVAYDLKSQMGVDLFVASERQCYAIGEVGDS